ncbi:MAG: hypothetical protein CMH80_04075 [Nitrospinae bacterium]|nr:hypothetical protein [Nitrospinota bacterium]
MNYQNFLIIVIRHKLRDQAVDTTDGQIKKTPSWKEGGIKVYALPNQKWEATFYSIPLILL